MSAELAAAYERITELETTLAHVREAIEEKAPTMLEPALDAIDTALSEMVAQ